jgi:hypothetical protein
MSPLNPQDEHRVRNAWFAWLGALATDAEAALAAALAYKQLEGAARDRWLAAIEQDAESLDVPRVAIFAPLRRGRILRSMGPTDSRATPRLGASGLVGRARDGLRIATVTTPLYLDFVQVLACAYRPGSGFEWVRHDPIVTRASAPTPGSQLDGVELEASPLKALVDELAHVVVAHTRSGKSLPEGLSCFADLFDALGVDGALVARRD